MLFVSRSWSSGTNVCKQWMCSLGWCCICTWEETLGEGTKFDILLFGSVLRDSRTFVNQTQRWILNIKYILIIFDFWETEHLVLSFLEQGCTTCFERVRTEFDQQIFFNGNFFKQPKVWTYAQIWIHSHWMDKVFRGKLSIETWNSQGLLLSFSSFASAFSVLCNKNIRRNNPYTCGC